MRVYIPVDLKGRKCNFISPFWEILHVKMFLSIQWLCSGLLFVFNVGKGGHSNIVFVFVSPNATLATFCPVFLFVCVFFGYILPVIFYCTLRQRLKEESENLFSGGFFFPWTLTGAQPCFVGISLFCDTLLLLRHPL